MNGILNVLVKALDLEFLSDQNVCFQLINKLFTKTNYFKKLSKILTIYKE